MLLRFTFQALTSSNVRETFCWIAETPATRLHKSEKENWPDPDTEKAQEPRAVVTTPSCEAILFVAKDLVAPKKALAVERAGSGDVSPELTLQMLP